MKAVTGEGAPWYTSGVHMWNGTAAILKAKPIVSRPAATRARAREAVSAARASAMPPMLVVPVAP
jgi:hypothetical protein